MRRSFLVVALLGFAAVSTGAALAAELHPAYKAPVSAATSDWSGFYLGAHVGAATGQSNWADDGTYDAAGASVAAYDPAGLLGGAQAGFNYQVGSVLLGLEASASKADIRGRDGSCYDLFAGLQQTCGGHGTWLASARGRLGWAAGPTLIYATGGVAWSHHSYDNPCTGCVSPNSFASATHAGWVAGAGVEYAFRPAWSLKVEYSHFDFGTDHLVFTPVNGDPDGYFGANISEKLEVVTVGVNYHFGGNAWR